MNIAVFCSGNGSNFQAIADARRGGLFKAEIALMVCDNPDAYAIKRAQKEGVKVFVAERNKFQSKREFEDRITQELKKHDIGLICLAGYMRILSPDFVARYGNKIINIHPALLPSFKGAHGIKDAMDYGVKTTGVTVHFVTPDMDAGPIILQEAVRIEESDTEDALADRIHNTEHRLYPEAIRLFTEGKLSTVGRKVKILAAVAMFLIVFGFAKTTYSNDMIPLPSVSLPSASLKEEIKTTLDNAKVITKEKVLDSQESKPIEQAPDKLGIFSFELYDVREVVDSDIGVGSSINPTIDTERPLTKEEIEQMRIEHSVRAARTLAEVMDSLNFKAGYDGINSAIETAKNIISFRNSFRKKYHLHFRINEDEVLFRYKKRF